MAMKDDYLDYADGYGILKTEKVGTVEFYIGEKAGIDSSEYIFGTVDRQLEDLGVISYHIDKKSNDYSEIIEVFYNAIHGQSLQNKQEREKEPDGKLIHDDCLSIYDFETLKGKVVVLNADILQREYRSIAHQLYLADGGFGCHPKSSGNAIFAYNLYTGKEVRIEKYEVLGVIKDKKMPEWAKENLIKIQQKKKSKEMER